MLEQRILDLIEKPLESQGYAVVQVKWLVNGKYQTLQIFADKLDGERLSVGDCEVISRNVSAILDVEDVISDRYHLEVSSPGIDRPLVKLTDFVKYTGFQARFHFKIGVELEGTEFVRRKFKGKILKVDGDKLEFETEDKLFAKTDFSNIESAKLVLSDELIKAKI